MKRKGVGGRKVFVCDIIMDTFNYSFTNELELESQTNPSRIPASTMALAIPMFLCVVVTKTQLYSKFDNNSKDITQLNAR